MENLVAFLVFILSISAGMDLDMQVIFMVVLHFQE